MITREINFYLTPTFNKYPLYVTLHDSDFVAAGDYVEYIICLKDFDLRMSIQKSKRYVSFTRNNKQIMYFMFYVLNYILSMHNF